MKRGFTLVELIVVIGIIAILSAVLLGTFSSSTESARAVKCLSNLRTLAQAARGGGSATCGETPEISTSGGAKAVYLEVKGWISGDTRGFYETWFEDLQRHGSTSEHKEIPSISLYETDREKYEYALTNGWMYARVDRRSEVFVCPTHAERMKGQHPHWSYVMRSGGGGLAERTLIFAEVPFLKNGADNSDANKSEELTDAVLPYPSEKEHIQGNHKVGSHTMAHVAFVDGHVEKLRVDGLSEENLKELTNWLCEGKAVGRNGDKYEELDKNEGQD